MATQYTSETSAKRQILLLAGTRPEAIKLAPIARAAKLRGDFNCNVLATGQQTNLFNDIAAELRLSVKCRIDAFSSTSKSGANLFDLTKACHAILKTQTPDLVIVQGDTNSALAGAQAAHALGIPVGHVEAGLRSHNLQRPWPEEPNRIAIAKLATLHFAPSVRAAHNLRQERVGGRIVVTGNTGIDALTLIRPKRPPRSAKPVILVTCHRRENFGAPMERIMDAIRQIASTAAVQVILPLHSNPNAAAPAVAWLTDVPNVSLIPALGYAEMIGAIKASHFVLSDSGGLQEECAALGVPLLLMREETERPEVVAEGVCRLVGCDTGPIVRESHRLIEDRAHHAAMARSIFPYGRGGAAGRILDAIALHFGAFSTMASRHEQQMDPRELAVSRSPAIADLSRYAGA